jgi:SAM-dependent methyltransferase
MASVSKVDAESGGSLRARFVATIFTGSFLLFLVQPMIARMALPRLGGAPSVWNSAMLVYQLLLLAGYAYAHWLGKLGPQRQAAIHLALLVLAGLTLPIGLMGAIPPPDANPFLWVPWLLLLSIGPLFFVVSAQAPLLQRWFALEGGGDPYPLYAASNLGSFGGLIVYPLLAEPILAVSQQRWLWSLGYALLVLLVAWCGYALPQGQVSPQAEVQEAPAPGWRLVGKWIVLAAVPSGLILSTTLHITTDIAAMPLLWVLPLGAYLLSFTVAFGARRSIADLIGRFAPLILLLACFGIFIHFSWFALVFGAVAILNLFTASVALHRRLFDSRPPAGQLTLFYLALSVGGALGGLFCALIAPLIFNWTYEHLLLLVAAAWLMRPKSPFERIADLWDGDRLARQVTFGAIVFIALLLAAAGAGLLGVRPSHGINNPVLVVVATLAVFAIGNPPLFTISVAALLMIAGGWERLGVSTTPGELTRSFFGIYAVRPGDDRHSRALVHGTTTHGIQNLGPPERQRMETTYYVPRSGVGLAMRAAPALFGPHARIGVVGLGAGTLACYARPGQDWTFFEIDPAVVRIALDPSRFTFLRLCKPDAHIRIGDARLLIERAPVASADLLVVDAFSSDSVPMHLLTREAFADYKRLLGPDGLLLIHISNRFFDLRPVVAAAAASDGWSLSLRSYRPDWAAQKRNEHPSHWIALSQSPAALERLVRASGERWVQVRPRPGFAAWTDDHASVLPLIDLKGF